MSRNDVPRGELAILFGWDDGAEKLNEILKQLCSDRKLTKMNIQLRNSRTCEEVYNNEKYKYFSKERQICGVGLAGDQRPTAVSNLIII